MARSGKEAGFNSLSVTGADANECGHAIDCKEFSSCVIFVAKPSLEIVSISLNMADLLGLNIDAVVGRLQFWQERVFAEDWFLFQDKLLELETCGAVSFIHRVSDVLGLPVWVAHSLRKVDHGGEIMVHGCLVPICGEPRILALDQEIVARFIHKLGNHFQLLNLLVNSLKNSLPNFRESEILQETLDRAIDLTRTLSDCNQMPAFLAEVELHEVVKAAAESRISQFAATGIRLQIDLENIPHDMSLASDPYLLETALGHVLQNAWEATSTGTVDIGGSLVREGARGIARVYVRDTGCGIPSGELDQVTLPFFSTKKGHEGLGLTVASRVIEMHGGALRIESEEGSGTEVEILLPLVRH